MDTFLLPLAITLLLFISHNPSATAEFVRDYLGHPLKNGGSYYIMPDMMGPDEGPITWTNTSKSKPCPLFVTKGYQFEPYHDGKVTISYPILLPYILVGTPVWISFDDTNTPCDVPLLWSTKPDGSIDASYVVAGDITIKQSYRGSFIIVKSEPGSPYNIYKLQFCIQEKCLDVGTLSNNANLLAITPDPEMNPVPLAFTFNGPSSTLIKNVALA